MVELSVMISLCDSEDAKAKQVTARQTLANCAQTRALLGAPPSKAQSGLEHAEKEKKSCKDERRSEDDRPEIYV